MKGSGSTGSYALIGFRNSSSQICDKRIRTLTPLLGGSGAVISRVISRVTILITHIRGLITLLITTHEPPSTYNSQARTI